MIVPRTDSAPDLESVATFLRECGMATYKHPEQVEIWDALPKNAIGKVLKHEIRRRLLRHLER